MISIRIFCFICGGENICPIPVANYKKTYKSYACGHCEDAHLFDVIDAEESE